jgi:hypothetical protein
VTSSGFGEIKEIHGSHENREGEEEEKDEGRIELLDPEARLEIPVLLVFIVEGFCGLRCVPVKGEM